MASTQMQPEGEFIPPAPNYVSPPRRQVVREHSVWDPRSEPGTYILLPERQGFLHGQATASGTVPTLILKPGEHLTEYRLEMTPRAILSGRVVDGRGEGVASARLELIGAGGLLEESSRQGHGSLGRSFVGRPASDFKAVLNPGKTDRSRKR